MVQFERNSVIGHKEMEIPFTLIRKEEGSKRLAIIFPGVGYTAQAPLLHYAMNVFLSKGYDVLQVNYPYNNNQAYADFSEVATAIKVDVKAVLDELLKGKNYEDFCLIGKSLGTIAMSTELHREAFKNAKAIWLTPLIQREDVLDAMVSSEQKGLCIIGDHDFCYSEERYLKVVGNENITAKLIPNVDHSLEYEADVLGSVEVLREVVREMEGF